MKYRINATCSYGHPAGQSYDASLGREWVHEQAVKAYGKPDEVLRSFVGQHRIAGTPGSEACRQCGTKRWKWTMETEFDDHLPPEAA